ncbi:transposase [Rhizobium sp. BK176]|nr:transposase [Rhizobium sp. BK181]MBB3543172.1 transposase [Rhizobium sp. BK399]MCS3744215.1 transposase [Rhizobium sp. BK661]MCS4096514.1 transposase [Rhizobium sp. BK176]
MLESEVLPHFSKRILSFNLAASQFYSLGTADGYIAATAVGNGPDRAAYKQRNVVERMFCRLKDWRRLATRFDRNIKNVMGAVALAAAVIWWL